jgi:gamma-glutamyltranspeptidase / glutathione hydrolase
MLTRMLSLTLTAAVVSCAQPVPLPSTGPDIGKRFVGEHGVVASGNPYASDAGVEVLRQGGNAVDAAVAATFAIGVVEPMMSGLGAGGGMLIWRQGNARADYLDFYSAAGAAGADSVRTMTGSRISARGAAIPGAVAGLLAAHAKYGKLSRAAVMAPAIRLAREGYTANSLLAREVLADSLKIQHSEGARAAFMPNGKFVKAGDHVVQPQLAATLERVAAEGADGFYRGPVAEELARVFRADGSPITTSDLASYAPQWKRPLCTTYRGRVVLSAPPPQSGVEVLEALNILEGSLDAPSLPSREPASFAVLAGALKTSVGDRGRYIGDPRLVAVPAAGLVSKAFLTSHDAWAADTVAAPTDCARYQPYGTSPVTHRPEADGSPDDGAMAETTHLSVVDNDGNAVSLTNTNGLGFGSGAFAAGFLLNSAMYNFSRDESSPNAAAPFKIPASTIAPTILLSNGRVEMVVGSPGSAAIPPAIVQTIVYTLDYHLDPLQALRMPRIIPSANGRLQIEDGFSNEVLARARAMGFDVVAGRPTDMSFGGVHVITRVGSRWVGAADPRRDGEVRGY